MNLARIRKLAGLNQEQLADKLKVSQTTISRAENMDDGTTLKIYKDSAVVLNCTLGDIFADDFRSEELRLVRAFRAASPERRRGWIEALEAVEGPAR